jgi:hypothetical protein
MKKEIKTEKKNLSDKMKNSGEQKESLVTLEKVEINKVQWTAASAFPCS